MMVEDTSRTDSAMDSSQRERLVYRRRHRLSHDKAYQRVFSQGTRASKGSISVFVLGNDLDHPRLGLSVGRRVGHAVKRNRFKRLIREAFRLHQYDFPCQGVDIVVTAQPHELKSLQVYEALLVSLVANATNRMTRKSAGAGQTQTNARGGV